MNTRFRWILVGIALLVAVGANARESVYSLSEIFVPQTSQFAPHHAPAAISSFDLSPDGKTLAVAFGTQGPDKAFGDWVALWNVATQRLIAAREIESNEPTQLYYGSRSLPPVRGPILWYSKNVRFSPDGRMLLVLTGPSLVALRVPSLSVLYSIEDRVPGKNLEKQMLAEGFAAGGNHLAVLEQISHNSPACCPNSPACSLKVIIADLATGRVLAQWTRPGLSHSIALSPDGKLVALTVEPNPWGYRSIRAGENDVVVLTADSGQLVKALSSGYVPGDARFLPGGEQLVIVPSGAARAPNDAIEVWNLKTGRLERKLGYPKVGVGGDMAVSANGERVAVINIWEDPTDLRFDRDNPRGYARLVLWNLRSGELVYDSGNLGPEYDLTGMPIGTIVGSWSPQILVRMSASGDRLAVGGEIISVRSVQVGSRQALSRAAGKDAPGDPLPAGF